MKRAELVDPDSVYGGGNGAAVDDELKKRHGVLSDSHYGEIRKEYKCNHC